MRYTLIWLVLIVIFLILLGYPLSHSLDITPSEYFKVFIPPNSYFLPAIAVGLVIGLLLVPVLRKRDSTYSQWLDNVHSQRYRGDTNSSIGAIFALLVIEIFILYLISGTYFGIFFINNFVVVGIIFVTLTLILQIYFIRYALRKMPPPPDPATPIAKYINYQYRILPYASYCMGMLIFYALAFTLLSNISAKIELGLI